MSKLLRATILYPTDLILNVASFTYEGNLVKRGPGGVPVQVPASGKMSVVTLDSISCEMLDSMGHVYIYFGSYLYIASLYMVGWGREVRISLFPSPALPPHSCFSRLPSFIALLPGCAMPCHLTFNDLQCMMSTPQKVDFLKVLSNNSTLASWFRCWKGRPLTTYIPCTHPCDFVL